MEEEIAKVTEEMPVLEMDSDLTSRGEMNDLDPGVTATGQDAMGHSSFLNDPNLKADRGRRGQGACLEWDELEEGDIQTGGGADGPGAGGGTRSIGGSKGRGEESTLRSDLCPSARMGLVVPH